MKHRQAVNMMTAACRCCGMLSLPIFCQSLEKMTFFDIRQVSENTSRLRL